MFHMHPPSVTKLRGFNLTDPSGSPVDDPDLWLWVTSDYGITYDPVTFQMQTTNDWLDRSGNDRHLSSVVERYTVYRPFGAQNYPMPSEKPIVHFDPTDPGGPPVPSQFTSLVDLGVSNLTRPCTIYLLLNVPAWEYPKYFFDGGCQVAGTSYGNTAGISMQPNQNTRVALSAPELMPALVDPWNALVPQQWFVLTAKFDGANSTIQFNNGTVRTGSTDSTPVYARQPQSAFIGGIPTNGSFHAEFYLGACIISHSANSEAVQTLHKNYLADYAGITI